LLGEFKVMDEIEAIELRVASNWHLWRVAANLHAQQDTERLDMGMEIGGKKG